MFTNRNETNGNKIILLLQKLMDKLWILFTCDHKEKKREFDIGKSILKMCFCNEKSFVWKCEEQRKSCYFFFEQLYIIKVYRVWVFTRGFVESINWYFIQIYYLGYAYFD